MKHVKILFKQHLTNLENLLTKSSQQKSPAVWLVNNNARTQLFYLESIARLLSNFDNKKSWHKLNELFKSLEDALGAIDHFNQLTQDFKKNSKIPKKILISLHEQKKLAEFKVNALLQKQGWISKKEKNQLNQIKAISKKINWPSDILFKKNLRHFYIKQIKLIQKNLKNPLTDIESGIHELRRDVRWLSIYPQAFKGFLLLKPENSTSHRFDKYLTKEIINSPFNQLNQVDGITKTLLLNQPNFYAMSWLIAALGQLKDQGLKLEVLTKEWVNIEGVKDEQANVLSLKALGTKQASQKELLSAANFIVKHINRDGVLSGLLSSPKK